MARKSTKSTARLVVRYLVLAVFVVGALFPLYWVFVSSVQAQCRRFQGPAGMGLRSVVG